MTALLVLVAGIGLAAIGGELFVRGLTRLSQRLNVPEVWIASTLGALATSAPELAVGLVSAYEGVPQISLGDALGSNVVNLVFILGLLVVIAPVTIPPAALAWREYGAALATPIVVGGLLYHGSGLSRMDGAMLLVLFAGWLALATRDAWRARRASPRSVSVPLAHAILPALVGIGSLIVSGRLLVDSARSLAESVGMSDFIIGATVVAFGTSVPEVATAVVSRWRGHGDIALGTLFGSNIFNGLFIIGIAACITPYSVRGLSVISPLVFGVIAVLLFFPAGTTFGRLRGALALLAYLLYAAAVYYS